MKITGKHSLSAAVKWLILAAMFVGAALLIGLPWTLKWLMSLFNEGTAVHYKFYLIILYPIGLCLLFILSELRIMFLSLEETDPFVYRNVTALRRMAVAAGILCILFVIKMFVVNTLMTVLSFFVFFVAMLLSFILGDVFQKAVEYKQYHDLTI